MGAVIDASKSSMGMDISPVDLLNIDMFASRVIGITEYRKELSAYLRSKMSVVAPNLAVLIGDTVGARLISHAGSLTNLAKCPASTVQILGAEKALFRALKTKGNTPKYGLIFHSSFIGRAGAKNKGRISRYLANKCSIASRIDCFSEESTTIFGTKLKEQVEDRLKFYETGDLPRKNVEVMAEAVEEAAEESGEFTTVTKKEKKKKKRKAEEMDSEEVEVTASKEKKIKTDEPEVAEPASVEAPETPKSEKKKKKKAAEETEVAEPAPVVEAPETPKSEKKKKKKAKEETEVAAPVEEMVVETPKTPKSEKKKKKKAAEETEVAEPAPVVEATVETPKSEKKKEKKKDKSSDE